MNIERFQAELPRLFPGDDLFADHPSDRGLRALMDDVPGMSSENALALLRLATSLLSPDEAYLEVGSYKGLSLTAAMLGNLQTRFFAIESFREFGVDPEASRKELFANVDRWTDRDRLVFLEGDCFDLFQRKGIFQHPIGVYFYDGVHGRLAQYLALGMAEPLLADDALVIIDDASWPTVAEPTDRYVSRHGGYELLFNLRASGNYDAKWWNGIRVYRFRRSVNGPRQAKSDLLWRRLLYLHLYEPTVALAWRVLSPRPRLMAAIRRVIPTKQVKAGIDA